MNNTREDGRCHCGHLNASCDFPIGYDKTKPFGNLGSRKVKLNSYLIDDGVTVVTIDAGWFSVDTDGELYFSTTEDGTIAVFAPGTWKSCLLLKDEN